MTKLRLEGSWNAIKGELKQKYGNLTDDDLRFAQGKEGELSWLPSQETWQIKEELRTELDGLRNYKLPQPL